MTLLKILLEPNTPLWIKIGTVILSVGVIAAWWTRDYWEDLHTPDKVSDRRKARPPF